MSIGPEVTFEADEDYQLIALSIKTGAMHAAVVACYAERMSSVVLLREPTEMAQETEARGKLSLGHGSLPPWQREALVGWLELGFSNSES